MTIPLGNIEVGCPIVLVATNGNIYTGTAVLDTTVQDGVKYIVALSLSTESLKHVTIMASRDSDGTAPEGSVSPYGSQTFPNSDTSFIIYAFPSLGYRISHIETSANGTTWSTLSTESYVIEGNQILINTITNNMRYSVVFVPLEFTATINSIMPNDPSWTGASDQLTVTVSSGTESWSGNTATISGVE